MQVLVTMCVYITAHQEMLHISKNFVTNIAEVSFLNCLGCVVCMAILNACYTLIQMLILTNNVACILSGGIEGYWRHKGQSLIFSGSYGSYTFRRTF